MSNKEQGLTGVRMMSEGSAPVLNYNVPEPTAYNGRTYIELNVPDDYFIPVDNGDSSLSARAFGAYATSPAAASPLEELRKVKASGDRLTKRLSELTEEDVERQEREGKKLSLYKTMTGAWSYRFISKPAAASAQSDAHLGMMAALKVTDDGGMTPPIRDNGGYVPMMDGEDDPWGGGEDPPPSDPIPSITATITAPAANANLTGPHTGAVVDIKGAALVVGGTLGSVKVKIGTGVWQSAQVSGSSWVLPGAVISEQGLVTIQAQATHSSANKSYIAMRKVNVALEQAPDVTPPSIAITSPAAGAQLTTNNGPAATVVVQGTASDDRGVTKVEILVDGASPVLATTTNNFATWSKSISVPSGNHAISARCYDEKGHMSEASLDVSVDTTAPAISITSPMPGANIAGTYSKGAVIEVFGTASDNTSIDVVEVSLNDSPAYARAIPKAPGDWSVWKATLNTNLPGTCVIKARATDTSGNTMIASMDVKVTILPEISSRKNRIILIESYRLSSFHGNYGGGRTLKTFSLLPGEKTKISIKSFTQTEESRIEASTILDSVTDDIADEFEKSIGDETTNKISYDSSNEYKLEASMGVSWGGWGNASASASTSGATNAAREQMAKNIVNSTQKHVAKASARRDVQVNTTNQVKETSSEEATIVREIENINMSRTLNFVFRQMNQEFITLLHLVDVRIGFYREEDIGTGDNKFYQEVTLPELDRLLEMTVVEDKRQEVRNTIIYQLMNIFDYQDYRHAFVEEAVLRDETGEASPATNYLRVKKDYYSEYFDESTGTKIKVPGIILAANQHVLRTEGIVVDAVLGQGEALDEYSSKLQLQSVREKELKNDLLQTEVRMRELALQILETGDSAAAALYAMLNPQPVAAEEEEAETAALLR